MANLHNGFHTDRNRKDATTHLCAHPNDTHKAKPTHKPKQKEPVAVVSDINIQPREPSSHTNFIMVEHIDAATRSVKIQLL